MVITSPVELAAIDVSGIAFGTRDGNRVAFIEHLGCIAAADERRDTELSRDDRRMTGTPAAIGDDRAGPLHHRLPVGIGHVGNQDVSCLDPIHLARRLDHPHRSRTDLLADCTPVGQRLAVLLETVFLHHRAGTLAHHGFGTRLQDVELAVVTTLAPFDVHRAAIVLFDDHRITRELEHILVVQGELGAFGFRDIDRCRGATCNLLVGEHHLDELGAQIAANHRRLALPQRRLVNIELVRFTAPCTTVSPRP